MSNKGCTQLSARWLWAGVFGIAACRPVGGPLSQSESAKACAADDAACLAAFANAAGSGSDGSGGPGSGQNGMGTAASGSPMNGAVMNGMQGAAMNGMTAGADSGVVSPQCGNGMLEMGETCDPQSTCPTPETCVAPSSCLRAELTGSAATCNVECNFVEITQCLPGDGCCPKDCTNGNDSDCSANCGDGIVSDGETCEPTNPMLPCPESCDDGDPCTKDVRLGTPEQCNVACTNTPITQPMTGDQCCPPNANAVLDADCDPQCGNGIKEGDEVCDGKDCPSSCDDEDDCTTDELMGTAAECTATCGHAPITRPSGGDRCCPPGANANNDSDCAPKCGNDVKESGETCDGDCPTFCNDLDPCTRDDSVGSVDKCTAECKHSTVTQIGASDDCCPRGANATNDADCSPICGNRVKEDGEKCDGSDCPTERSCAGPDPCTEYYVEGSALRCDAECGERKKATCCGNGMKEAGEECDGDDCKFSVCDDGNGCTTEMLVGSEADCSKKCLQTGKMGDGAPNICGGCVTFPVVIGQPCGGMNCYYRCDPNNHDSFLCKCPDPPP